MNFPKLPKSRKIGTVMLSAATFFASAMVANAGTPTPPVKANTTFEVTVTCPIDGQPFKTRQVASYFQSGMRLDFKPIGALIVPYPYPVCPGNGFVIYQQEFSAVEITAIRAIVATDEYRRLRAENTDYFVVAYVKERMGAAAYELGHTYLRATWEAERDVPRLVQRYRELALEKFNAFVHGKRGGSEDWWTASVLAAELDRLLGHFDAVETRYNALPLSEMSTSYPDLKNVLDQIRAHALRHNSRPEQMLMHEIDEGTIGRRVTLEMK